LRPGLLSDGGVVWGDSRPVRNKISNGAGISDGICFSGLPKNMKIKAKKIGMSQIWKGDKVIPISILRVESKDRNDLKELEVGTKVIVRGRSKGKGFQGVVKRHGFHGGPKSHGQKDRHRAPGSIGATAPQRVLPGKKMAGRMGNDRITLKAVLIEKVEPEKGEIALRGPVPGMKKSFVMISHENKSSL